MPIVSTLPLLPLGSQPTAQKFENKFSYALGSPPINTRTQAPHVNPHPDNNLHILLNIGLKQKVEFCKRKNYGVQHAGMPVADDGRQLCLSWHLIGKCDTGCKSHFDSVSGVVRSDSLHRPASTEETRQLLAWQKKILRTT